MSCYQLSSKRIQVSVTIAYRAFLTEIKFGVNFILMNAFFEDFVKLADGMYYCQHQIGL